MWYKIKQQMPSTIGEWFIFILFLSVGSFCISLFIAFMKLMWNFILG